MNFKKIVALQMLWFAFTSAWAADFFVENKLRDISPGTPLQVGETIGGYAIYPGEGKWRFSGGRTSDATIGNTSFSLGSVTWTQSEGGSFVARMDVRANLQQAGGNSWGGSPCTQGHLVMVNKPSGQADNCLTIDAVSTRVNNKEDVTVLNVSVIQRASNSRMYELRLLLNPAFVGFPGTVVADWAPEVVKTKPDQQEFVDCLSAWAQKLQDAAALAIDFKKPQDVFANIPLWRSLAKDGVSVAVGGAKQPTQPSQPQPAQQKPSAQSSPVRWKQVDPFVPAAAFAIQSVPLTPAALKYRISFLQAYADWKGPKAMAVAPDGSWFESERQSPGSRLAPEQIMQIALEKCEWWSRTPCAAYALGDQVAADMTQIPLKPHTSVLAPIDSFEAGRLPFTFSQAATGISEGYKSSKFAYKALAVSANSGNFSEAGSNTSMDAAVSEVLKTCSANAGNVFCSVYAQGEKVVIGNTRSSANAAWPPQAPKRLQLLLIAAPNSEPLQKWESFMGKLLSSAAWFSSIEMTRAYTSGPDVVATNEFIPESFKWITTKIQPSKFDLTRLIFIVDDVPMFDMQYTGSNYLSLMESFAKRKQQ